MKNPLAEILAWILSTPGYILIMWVVGWEAYTILNGSAPLRCDLSPYYRPVHFLDRCWIPQR